MAVMTNIAASTSNRSLVWYHRIVLLGVACNILVGLAGIAVPTVIIELLKLEPATPLVWARFAAFLLILLSLFYIPGALAPAEKRFEAVYNVVCRAGGVVFFLFVGGPYLVFGLYDFLFGLPQAILLWRGLSGADSGK